MKKYLEDRIAELRKQALLVNEEKLRGSNPINSMWELGKSLSNISTDSTIKELQKTLDYWNENYSSIQRVEDLITNQQNNA